MVASLLSHSNSHFTRSVSPLMSLIELRAAVNAVVCQGTLSLVKG